MSRERRGVGGFFLKLLAWVGWRAILFIGLPDVGLVVVVVVVDIHYEL